MTIPEWVMILLVTCILAVLGWGAKRLVQANDETSKTLIEIATHLAVMNGRLGKTETLMTVHADFDEKQFAVIRETTKELWHAINNPDRRKGG